MNTASISGLDFSGSGCGSPSTNLVGNCSFNRFRMYRFCFLYSAFISACFSSFSLLSFLKFRRLNNPSSIHSVPSSDAMHNGNGHPGFRVFIYVRILRTIGFPLLSLLFSLDYTRSCYYRNIFFRFTEFVTSLKNRETLQYLWLHYTICLSCFHLTELSMSSL